MHNLHTGVFFFSFFFCFCSRVQITPLPPTFAFTCQNILFLCRKQTNKQTKNHDVILISTCCLQICNWQRQSSVSTVNRALLLIWILLLFLPARTVSVVVSTPAFQPGHPWFKSGWGYVFIVFVDFIFFFHFYYVI